MCSSRAKLLKDLSPSLSEEGRGKSEGFRTIAKRQASAAYSSLIRLIKDIRGLTQDYDESKDKCTCTHFLFLIDAGLKQEMGPLGV